MKINDIGLTEKQAIESRLKYGSNEISRKKQNSFFKLFLESLGEPMTKILIIALAIKTLFLLSNFDWYETVGIALAIFIASFISTISEYGSEASFKKLQEEASKINCQVYRDGKLKEININDIVRNDIILLQAGNKVPADGIVISGSVYVNEAVLNGENKEVLRDITNNNKLLRGSVVCYGECKMLVTAVGDNTLYGKIGLELQEEQRDSPLKHRLRMLAKDISRLGYIGAFLVVVSFLFDVIVIKNNFDLEKIKSILTNIPLIIGYVLHAVTLAVTVIVVAVPEGLPMMITLVLSRNMRKMLKDNILVRKLLGIETSGSLNILFTDKTGTLTKGKLQVVNFIDCKGNNLSLLELEKRKKIFEILQLSLFYNNASTIGDNGEIIGGNATDRALLEYIISTFPFSYQIKKDRVIPFDSRNKYSITKISGDYNMWLIKGMPEKIIEACRYYYDELGNKKIMFDKSNIYQKMEKFYEKAIRFIAIATSDREITKDLKKSSLTLVGVIGIRDEIREGVIEALEQVKQAGVQVVMMTGDAKETALAIAKDIGLLDNDSLVITSDELANMADEKLKTIIPKIKVIARALPSDKSRLVRICQEIDLVVGMTGDGVNDAPAIKKADVGFAMGSGTEVAKEASDIVILDDNFLSISKTILYGRTIFKNIRKFIILQLTINMCAVGLSIIGPFIGIDNPITIIQMLWINMIMDTLAALAFAGEPALEEYMQEKPKKRDEPIVNRYMKGQILFTGLYSMLLCLLFLKLPFFNRLFGNPNNPLYLLTAFFALFIFVGIFNCFNARTHRLNLLAHLLKNKGFIIILSLVAIIQIYIIYYGGELFRVVDLDIIEFIGIIFLSFTVIPVDWLRKLYLRFYNEKGGV
ncbi:MAG: calcium-translocating P-type ATPase, PMCA-type [Mollicutes bacterium]|nr:calcium-translocating P-type ATPase, PMCA-type [Mollicutes bacterium]